MALVARRTVGAFRSRTALVARRILRLRVVRRRCLDTICRAIAKPTATATTATLEPAPFLVPIRIAIRVAICIAICIAIGTALFIAFGA